MWEADTSSDVWNETGTRGAEDQQGSQNFDPHRGCALWQAGGAVGRPWGPCPAAQGAPLTPNGAGGGACAPAGDSAVCPLWLQRPPSRDLRSLSRCFFSGAPWGEAPSLPLSLGCELSSSIRAQGGAGLAVGGPPFAWQPLLWHGLGENEGLGQPSTLWGPRHGLPVLHRLLDGSCSNSCGFSRWCHPTISFSLLPFYFCLQSFPPSGSFLVSHLFASGGKGLELQVQHQFLQWIYRIDFL